MKKKKHYYIVGIIILLLAGGWYYWKNNVKTGTQQVQYVTVAAEKGTLTLVVSATGSIFVDQDATVDPTITGTVADLAVKVGDRVEAGQFLFSIINDDLSVNVTKASASYAQALNEIKSAELDKKQVKADYEAAKKKDDKDPTAYTSKQLKVLKDKIELREDAIVQARKNAAVSLASYRNEQVNAAKRKVAAPIGGTINEINIKNGDDLSRTSGSDNSSAPIIIGDLSTLKAAVQVNEVDIAKVQVGQKVTITLDALDSLNMTGKVEKIDSLGTSSQGVVTYDVTISFDSLDERIKPQMSVSANIVVDVKQDAVLVPVGGVKNEGEQYYVELLVDGVLQQKDVKVGISDNLNTEIISGLNVGDEVVTQTIDNASGSDSAATGASSNRSGGGIGLPGLGGGPGR
jgi:macrolide-specific efflux system membrane fusion protein